MQAAIRRSLWSASKLPARFVAGRRHTSRTLRNFSSSPERALSFPFPTPAPPSNEVAEQNDAPSNHPKEEHDAAPSVTTSGGDVLEVAENERQVELSAENGNGNGNGNGDKDRSHYGSGLRRSMRNKRPKDIPPWDVPDWFFARNVKLHNSDPPLTYGGLEYDQPTSKNNGDGNNVHPDDHNTSKKTSSTTEPHATRPSDEGFGQYLSIVRNQLSRSTEDENDRRQSAEQMQSLLADIREELRTARRYNKVAGVVNWVEKLVGESSPELLDYKRTGNSSPHKSLDQGFSDYTEHEKPFQISSNFMNELLTLCAASFSTLHSSKAHLKLLCPIDGATYLVDRIVDEAASKLEADVVRLDSQDIAQIIGDYLSDGFDTAPDGLWNLGYDTGPFSSRQNEKLGEEEAEIEEEMEDEAEEFSGGRSTSTNKFTPMTSIPVIGIGPGGSISDLLRKLSSGNPFSVASSNSKSVPRSNGTEVQAFVPVRNGGQEWNDMKMSALLEFVLDANNVKERNDMLIANLLTARIYRGLERKANAERLTEETSGKQQPSLTSNKELMSQRMLAYGQGLAYENGRRTIVYIRGYRELRDTQKGHQILSKITELVRKKRKEGQEIMIVGASCSMELAPRLSGEVIEALQAESSDPNFRSLVIAPQTPESEAERQRLEAQLDDHAEHYLFSMNARHLHNMMLRMHTHQHDIYSRDWFSFLEHLSLESSERVKTELRQRLLSVDEVHRIIFTAIGTRNRSAKRQSIATGLDAKDIASAGMLVLESDSAKIDWAEEEQVHRDRFTKPRPNPKKDGAKSPPMPKKLSKREQRLMRGVINAEKIHTTFNDVHATEETIEALKTLTTLSLKRPDAFKYGVLATDKISGLLLYGPPGTGKTLLAKAVAKDTGATMLEVSGSDLYDMYVGEGEKNVAAVFSLAKKLAPCVVFIDEADAIFASRGSGGERKSHREMINQFLKEWDGMNETTAFIMVATNRPFDLDEAALRRLPRRILVDLPSEKDREAILGIHLKGEQVDESVAISKLANQTPLYSGSDLKNVAVAAALAAVREENDQAAKHEGEEPYQYPEKRILSQRHFDKAMEEISASISEDMDSLGAIKKFDEKYGDRRGRRKKTVYGFTGAEVKEETAKVRI